MQLRSILVHSQRNWVQNATYCSIYIDVAGYATANTVDGFVFNASDETAFYINNCAPVISHNRMTGGTYAYSSVIYCSFAWPIISNNAIYNNCEVLSCDASSPTLVNNTIAYNTPGCSR
jgi:hypothetical protein